MASKTAARKPVEVVLDPTKITTWKLVRQPPQVPGKLIQGLPRERNSSAMKEHRAREGVRLRKALNAMTHGKNIFAYHHIRTKQVVYSLTRYLEENNVLKQLVFHGKKTVPAKLRKDLWLPYYSVHFANPESGLRAYHLLREFSLLRQLSPPREMITITEQFLARKRPSNPLAAKEFDEKNMDKIGWLMHPLDRARVLMNQKATSVADIAAVLAIQEQEEAAKEQEQEQEQQQQQDGSAAGDTAAPPRKLPPSVRKRRRAERKKEELRAAAHAERIADFERLISNENYTYRIEEAKDDEGSLAVQGSSNTSNKNKVLVLWADVHNAKYAQSWPEHVIHGELDAVAGHIMPSKKPLDDDRVWKVDGQEKEILVEEKH